MGAFDLDLQAVEEHIVDPPEKDSEFDGNVVLAILTHDSDPETWLDHIDAGDVLVLCAEGDVNELAAGFARDVKESGGALVHFRGFLIVAPPEIEVDTSLL